MKFLGCAFSERHGAANSHFRKFAVTSYISVTINTRERT